MSNAKIFSNHPPLALLSTIDYLFVDGNNADPSRPTEREGY